MSLPRLVRNSPDLLRLVNEGYALRLLSGYLVVDDVPFVDGSGELGWGSLACPLDTQGDRTARPGTHVMWFVGGIPCTASGSEIPGLIHSRGPAPLTDGLVADCSFSQKAHGLDYADFHAKVTTYVGLIVGHAHSLDPEATPLTFRPIADEDEVSVFRFMDTNSSRAGIAALSDRLSIDRVGVVGLGGTGSYLLDFLAKCPVQELHLFDGDVFSTHNAFRSPGPTGEAELAAQKMKVDYHAARYSTFRRGLVPHAHYITVDNVDDLLTMDFVFLAMDASKDKKVIVERLTEADVPFIDSGMGIISSESGLRGLIRTTTSLAEKRDHISCDGLLAYTLGDDDEYETNVQVAELNALAAGFAVIKFKKWCGFFHDEGLELHSLYGLTTNDIVNRYREE